MEVLTESGIADIGASMKQTSQKMYEYLKETGVYEIDLKGRYVIEEHLFSNEWFECKIKIPEYKLWLPIKMINDCR